MGDRVGLVVVRLRGGGVGHRAGHLDRLSVQSVRLGQLVVLLLLVLVLVLVLQLRLLVLVVVRHVVPDAEVVAAAGLGRRAVSRGTVVGPLGQLTVVSRGVVVHHQVVARGVVVVVVAGVVRDLAWVVTVGVHRH